MKTIEADQKKVSVSNFKAHCTEYLRAVENGEPAIFITRHGKVIAVVNQPQPESKQAQSVAEWIGSGRGTVTFSPDYDPHAPAFDDDEWDMHNED